MKWPSCLLWLLCAWVLLVAAPDTTYQTHAQAQETDAVRLDVTPAFDGRYLPGAWLPLYVTLHNNGAAFDATIVATPPVTTTLPVTATLPGALPHRYTMSVEVAANAEEQVTLYVPMEQPGEEVLVTVERAGSVLTSQIVALTPHDKHMVGIITEDESPLLALLSRTEPDQSPGTMPGTIVALPVSMLPDHAPVLRNFGVLLLPEAPAQPLTEAQQQAVVSWVWHGGHLVLGGGTEAQQILTVLPETLRPANIGRMQTLDSTLLASLTDSPAPNMLQGVQLLPAEGSISSGMIDAPLWIHQNVNAGRITQLAFAPEAPALAIWEAAPSLWDHLLQPAMLTSGSRTPRTTIARAQEQIATATVGYVPALNLPPASWLFGLLLLYLVVVIPGCLALLRRYDRLHLGWLILPGVALATATLIAGLSFVLRADQRLVSQVSIIEQIEPDTAHVRTFVGLFTPHAYTFQAQRSPGVLVRPLSQRSAPFPDSAIGTITGAQGDIPQQARTFPIPAQSGQLQGVIAEETTTFPGLDTQIVIQDDTIAAQVDNTTGQPLRNVVVAYGEQLARLGDLDPGQERTVAWMYTAADASQEQPPFGASLSTLIFDQEAASVSGGRQNRHLNRQEKLIAAVIKWGPQPADPGPWLFAWLDQPPATLTVETGSAAVEQTTLLIAQPAIRGSGAIRLPPGWLRPDLTAPGATICQDAIPGVAAQMTPVVLTLRLPADLAALEATSLVVTMDSARPWPNTGVITHLYNWQRNQWVAFDYDGPGDLELPDPTPYLKQGTLLVRLDGRITEGRCIFAQAEVGGRLP